LVRVLGGVVIPFLALVLIAWLLAGSSWSETPDVVMAVAAGAELLAVTRAREVPAAAGPAEESNDERKAVNGRQLSRQWSDRDST
jgi:zinc transporter ZupT